jgi:pSer/pThr/pTyr-binding forkhead associated (FHA) protein
MVAASTRVGRPIPPQPGAPPVQPPAPEMILDAAPPGAVLPPPPAAPAPAPVSGIPGPPVAVQTSCAQCGTALPDSHTFCGHCGAVNARHTPTLPMPQSALKNDRLGFIALIDDSGAESLQFPLIAGANRIGRGEGCQLRFPDDGFLAGVHCVLEVEPSHFLLKPVDAANGTYLRITTPIEIHHGDLLRVGQEVLRFERIDRLLPERGNGNLPEIVGWPIPRGVWGRLCQMGLGRQVANAYLLQNPDVFLGRERGDILFPKDGFVSGSHSVISDRNGRAFLKDLGSSNGTFLRVKQDTPLRNGDLFLLGRNLLRVHIGS